MTTKPEYFTAAQVQDAVDCDRIRGFLTLASNLPETAKMAVMTADQARSIARALIKAGYSAA